MSDVGSPTARKEKEVDGSEVLFECNPEKADRIIAIFNEEEDEFDEEPGKRKWQDK